jgi:hypothetical protein
MKKILLLSAILFASTCSLFCWSRRQQPEATKAEIETCLNNLRSVHKITTIKGSHIGRRLIEELCKKATDPNHSYTTILLPGWTQRTLHQYNLTDRDGNITDTAVRYTILNRWESKQQQKMVVLMSGDMVSQENLGNYLATIRKCIIAHLLQEKNGYYSESFPIGLLAIYALCQKCFDQSFDLSSLDKEKSSIILRLLKKHGFTNSRGRIICDETTKQLILNTEVELDTENLCVKILLRNSTAIEINCSNSNLFGTYIRAQ